MKKITYLLALLFAASTLFIGCHSDDPETPPTIVVADKETLEQTVFADEEEGESVVTITTAAPWTSSIKEVRNAETAAERNTSIWISITPESGGIGSYEISFELQPNTTGEDRTVEITIRGNDGFTITIRITQKAERKDGSTPVTGISLNESELELLVGETETLIATITPADATNRAVTWASSDTEIATVDNNGVVTALSVGTATITARTADGSFTATGIVTVSTHEVNEAKAIAEFISYNNFVILKEFPRDTVFLENEFFRDPATGVYFNIVSRGILFNENGEMFDENFNFFTEGELDKIQLGRELYVRFRGLNYFMSNDTTLHSNDRALYPIIMTFKGPVTMQNRYLYESGVPAFIVPLQYIGHGGRVRMIVPSNMGSEWSRQNFQAAFYGEVDFRFERPWGGGAPSDSINTKIIETRVAANQWSSVKKYNEAYHFFVKELPELTADVFNRGMIQVYFVRNQVSTRSQDMQLPFSLEDNSIVTFVIRVGQIEFRVIPPDTSLYYLPPDMDFRIVLSW